MTDSPNLLYITFLLRFLGVRPIACNGIYWSSGEGIFTEQNLIHELHSNLMNKILGVGNTDILFKGGSMDLQANQIMKISTHNPDLFKFEVLQTLGPTL